jgi:outer membrane scaffolding protein for murein synthesis (MipA/OmpV family)
MPSHTKKATYLSLLLGIAMASASLSTLAVRAADIANDTTKGDKEDVAPQPSDQSGIGTVRQALHEWNVVVGAGAIYKPKFEGSKEYEVSAVPFISAQFYDRITIDPTGLSVKAYDQGPFRFDVNVGYEGGREESDSDRLRGLGDVDAGATVGGKATVSWGPADFFLSVDQTLGGSEGLLATAGVSAQRPISERVILGAEGSVTYADDNYMQSYFGVSAAQSARSGLAQFDAEAGIKSAELSLSVTYLITDRWVLKAKETVGFLTGDAADSPIVEEDIQSKTLLLLGYRF